MMEDYRTIPAARLGEGSRIRLRAYTKGVQNN